VKTAAFVVLELSCSSEHNRLSQWRHAPRKKLAVVQLFAAKGELPPRIISKQRIFVFVRGQENFAKDISGFVFWSKGEEKSEAGLYLAQRKSRKDARTVNGLLELARLGCFI
jgi:hypothetical protein